MGTKTIKRHDFRDKPNRHCHPLNICQTTDVLRLNELGLGANPPAADANITTAARETARRNAKVDELSRRDRLFPRYYRLLRHSTHHRLQIATSKHSYVS